MKHGNDKYRWIEECTQLVFRPWLLHGHRTVDGRKTALLALSLLNRFLKLRKRTDVSSAATATTDWMQFEYARIMDNDSPADVDANLAIACAWEFAALVFASHLSLENDELMRISLSEAAKLADFTNDDLRSISRAEQFFAQMRELVTGIEKGNINTENFILRKALPKDVEYFDTDEFKEGISKLTQFIHEGKSQWQYVYYFLRRHGLDEMTKSAFGNFIHKHGGPSQKTVSSSGKYDLKGWKLSNDKDKIDAIASFFPHIGD